MAEPTVSPAPAPRRTPGGYVLLLVFWTLALASWLIWMAMIIYMLGRVFLA